MKFNAFTPIPEDEEELHLPELIYWASLGDLDEVTACLEKGIDVNLTDEDGYSALHAAAENGYLEIVKFLITKGANVHHKAEYTALELAEMSEQTEIATYLKRF